MPIWGAATLLDEVYQLVEEVEQKARRDPSSRDWRQDVSG